jgi:hypothetical protein
MTPAQTRSALVKLKPTAKQLAEFDRMQAQSAAALAAMTPEGRAANLASEAITDYVDALAAGDIEHDSDKFDALVLEHYEKCIEYGGTIASEAIRKIMRGEAA